MTGWFEERCFPGSEWSRQEFKLLRDRGESGGDRLQTVKETTGKTPAELFLGRKIITPFRKLVLVTDGAEYVGGNIEKLLDEARQNVQRQHKTWEKYYNRKRRAINIKVNDLDLMQTHFISAAGSRVVGVSEGVNVVFYGARARFGYTQSCGKIYA
ncbi:uncharacterized protein TNCV_1912921 [Trichonephila clavipes]|nr:uncharacterized protein TNCV_1912921 [Trichonephila clavipes]